MYCSPWGRTLWIPAPLSYLREAGSVQYQDSSLHPLLFSVNLSACSCHKRSRCSLSSPLSLGHSLTGAINHLPLYRSGNWGPENLSFGEFSIHNLPPLSPEQLSAWRDHQFVTPPPETYYAFLMKVISKPIPCAPSVWEQDLLPWEETQLCYRGKWKAARSAFHMKDSRKGDVS